MLLVQLLQKEAVALQTIVASRRSLYQRLEVCCRRIHSKTLDERMMQPSPSTIFHVDCGVRARKKVNQVLPERSAWLSTSVHHSFQSSARAKSLEEEYEAVLYRLIEPHLLLINEYLDRTEALSSTVQTESASDLLDSVLNNNYEISNTIKRLGQLQNINYQEVKTTRAQIERFMTPVSDYHWFLNHLYPSEGAISRQKLYEGYQALPTPRPLHISPQHLEDLISAFMDSRKPAHRAIFNTIIEDIVDCGMPISVHEYNTCAIMAMRSFNEDNLGLKPGSISMEQIERYRNVIATMKHRDSSTMNILFGFGLKSEQDEFISQSMREFQTMSIRPDRVTMMIYIMNEGTKGNSNAAKAVYQDMCTKGYAIDISVINVLLKSMLLSGDIEGAAQIFASITQRDGPKFPLVLKSPLAYISPPSVLIKIVKLIDTATRIIQENGIKVDQKSIQLPIVPDEFTFGVMMSHYCSKEGANLAKAFEIFKLMERFGVQPGFRHFCNIYDGFVTNSRSKAAWNRSALNQLTSMICDRYELLNTLQSRTGKSQVNQLFNKVLLTKAFKAYQTVFWDIPQKITLIQDDFNQHNTRTTTPPPTLDSSSDEHSSPNNEPPTSHTVYRALTKLLDIGLA